MDEDDIEVLYEPPGNCDLCKTKDKSGYSFDHLEKNRTKNKINMDRYVTRQLLADYMEAKYPDTIDYKPDDFGYIKLCIPCLWKLKPAETEE